MRVLLTSEPYAPIFGVRCADIRQEEFDNPHGEPGRLYLAGFLTTDARAEWVAMQGYEVVSGNGADTENPALARGA